MKITSVEVSNFKNLRHLILTDLPDLIVIAGPNGSGKTALFDALRLFKEAFGGYSLRSPGSSWASTILQQVGPVVTVGEEQATISVTIQVSSVERAVIELPDDHSDVLKGSVVIQPRSGRGERETISTVDGEDATYLRYLLGARYRAGGDIGVMNHIGPDRRFQSTQVTNITFSEDFAENELQRLVVNSADKFASLAQDLVMMYFLDLQEREEGVLEPHNYIEGVKQIFQHFLPDKEFVGIQLPHGLSSAIRVVVRSGGVEHEIGHLSSGQREILMTYAHLERLRPTGSIILFDEPELHLHPSLQRRVIAHLRNLIERGNNQIWTITHAEEIVGTTEYDNLFAMTGDSDPAIVRVQDSAERLELLQRLGASVGLQLTSPRILFVEGDSDSEILRLLWDPLPTGLSIVETSGKGNLMRLTPAAMQLLEGAVATGQFFMIRDRDVDDEDSSLASLATRYANKFFYWDRYHIENYLLDAHVIHHVLKADPDIPFEYSVDDVDDCLRSIAVEQRDALLSVYLEQKLNASLRKRIRLNPPEGVEQSLRKAASSRLQQVTDALNPGAIENVLAEVATDLDRRWDSGWKSICVGRNVLERYHELHVRKYYGYEVFRNRIARSMHQLNRVPAPISNIYSIVTAGLDCT